MGGGGNGGGNEISDYGAGSMVSQCDSTIKSPSVRTVTSLYPL